MTIRTATPEDAVAIAEAHVDAWRSAYRDILPASYLASLSVEKRATNWSTILAMPGALVSVAEEPPSIIGFVSTAPARDSEIDGSSTPAATACDGVASKTSFSGSSRKTREPGCSMSAAA
jgi:hypothetical protein